MTAELLNLKIFEGPSVQLLRFIYNQTIMALCAHLPFPCSLCVHCKTKNFKDFIKNFVEFLKIRSFGHTRPYKKFWPDRFSRFDVYWIQPNRQRDKQTDRQAKYKNR